MNVLGPNSGRLLVAGPVDQVKFAGLEYSHAYTVDIVTSRSRGGYRILSRGARDYKVFNSTCT